jgi:hypothetical protein
MRKIGDWAALVAGRDAEQILHRLGEAFDIEAGIEKKRAEVRSGQKVLKIAVRPRNQLKLRLQFTIDLIDCSSSLLVSSSSEVERYSSLIDCSSSFEARSSSLAASESSRIVRSRC